jgi:hypothetical protein
MPEVAMRRSRSDPSFVHSGFVKFRRANLSLHRNEHVGNWRNIAFQVAGRIARNLHSATHPQWHGLPNLFGHLERSQQVGVVFDRGA